MWKRLCEALELPHLVDDPDFADDPARVRHRDRGNAAVGAALARRGTAEWTERLLKAGVPCGPIHRVDQVFDDPQVRHLGMAWPVNLPGRGEVSLVRTPFRLSAHEQAQPPKPAPHQGDQTDAILHELGYDAAQIASLRAGFVV
jgi:crotonobetainyl-CoA:carnitine CoA-transferase CaiB-like acyl-CoA transferase